MDDKLIAGIIIATVGILVGLAFWPTISPNIGAMTKTFDSVNATMTLPAAGVYSELTMCGQKALTNTVQNATGAGGVSTNNYTITQATGADGYLAAKITTTPGSPFAGRSVNVSCNYEPKGYVTDGAGRSMVSLIAIAMALLIIVAAVPNLRNGILDLFG